MAIELLVSHVAVYGYRKKSCSPRVSRVMNGAMVEVSGKQQHSGLAGFAWEQGLDVCSFEARRLKMAIELLMSHVAGYAYLKEPAAPGLVGL